MRNIIEAIEYIKVIRNDPNPTQKTISDLRLIINSGAFSTDICIRIHDTCDGPRMDMTVAIYEACRSLFA